MSTFSRNEFVVSKKKVKAYLLNPNHPDGGGKARFFINLGFKPTEWNIFAQVLCEQAATYPISLQIETPFGTKCIIDGVINTPINKEVLVRTVWIVRKQKQKPELITAYPI